MKRISILTAAFLLAAIPCAGTEVVKASRWELHNSFWMSLHQTLMNDATRKDARDVAALSAEEQAAWNEAVTAYRTAAAGASSITFTRPMAIMLDALSQVADDAIGAQLDGPMAEALVKAAPVYRKHWWAADDAANQFFIAYAAPLLREAGDELVRQHSAIYRTPWPERIRLYVSPYAGEYGAYTITNLRNAGIVTSMSSRDPGYQGFRALEMILHEGSHAIVYPEGGTVGEAISAAVKKQHVRNPGNLWHAILFATSSELTRRYFAERGVDFVPSSQDMLTRVWSLYREPIEKYWVPYLSGQGTLEEAIDAVVAAIAASADKRTKP